LGTNFPVVFAFLDVARAGELPDGAESLRQWLRSEPRPFGESRLLLVLIGENKATNARRDMIQGALATCLVRYDVGLVEVRNAAQSAAYVAQCAHAVTEAKRRRTPSRFKMAGARCQTLPRDTTDKLRLTWVSQLMQLPGVSEEIAKAIANVHPSPAAMLEAVAQAADRSGMVAADSFIANLEYPIRGHKGMRRLGPVVSRRVFATFHPGSTPENMLV
jgi:hypothetical protein